MSQKDKPTYIGVIIHTHDDITEQMNKLRSGFISDKRIINKDANWFILRNLPEEKFRRPWYYIFEVFDGYDITFSTSFDSELQALNWVGIQNRK